MSTTTTSAATTTYNVRSKQSDNLLQKVGPMKATIPMSSLLRPFNIGGGSTVTSNLFSAMSPPMRHISPDHQSCGHRSPGSINYFKGRVHPSDATALSSCIRRTASLDTLYIRPSWNMVHNLQLQHIQHQASAYTILQLDKATQTDESYTSELGGSITPTGTPQADSNDIKIERVIRQRLQRTQRAIENSVSSQTLSPIHATANPVSIPSRPSSQNRPMRSSVEGLNQEIEKLVLLPGQPHTCRPESSLFPRGIPEGHRAPLADILHGDTRSVNTQTPSRDHLSSDESQSTSPEECASSSGGTGASPRINRFLAREPPDGCEKVCLKLTDTDQLSPPSTVFKPTVGFELKPSLGSAFQPLQPIAIPVASPSPTATDEGNAEKGNNAGGGET